MSEKAYRALTLCLDEGIKPIRDAAYAAGGYCSCEDDGFGCTLPRGHQGNEHIAHSSLGEVVHTWREMRH